MNSTGTASNSTRESRASNKPSSPNTLGGTVFKRIKLAVNNLALSIFCTEKISDNNQPIVHSQNRNLKAYSDTVAKAIEVLIGSDTAASPQSMLLSPPEINSTVMAFGGFLGHGSALARLNLTIEKSSGSDGLPPMAALQNALRSLGNNSPERAHRIARASLCELVKNIPEGAINSPALVIFARSQGDSALLLLKILNESVDEADAISTRTDLNIVQLSMLFRMLNTFVDTLGVDTPQHEDARQFAQHIQRKIIEVCIVCGFNPNRIVSAALPYLGGCSDMDVMVALVQKNGLYLRFANSVLSNNLDLVMTAVKQHGTALRFASSQIQDNLDVVMVAVQSRSLAFEYASPALRNNADVVMAVVQANGWALRFASPTLRNNTDVVMAAVQQNGWVLDFASPALRDTPAILAAAVRQNKVIFSYISPEHQANPEVIAALRL